MKILLINDSLMAGGRERRLIQLVKGLKKKEVNITLILFENTIHYKEIFDYDIQVLTLNRTRNEHKLKYFYVLYKYVKSFKPDIVHVWSNLSAFYILPVKILRRFKLINSQIANAPALNNISFVTKLNFYFADLILSNSKAGLKSYSVDSSKAHVIHNGFDPSRLNIRINSSSIKAKLKINTRFVIGMAARFHKHKDYESYLQVAKNLISTRSDVTFICFGSGSFESLKNEFSHQRILFLGQLDDVESVMSICDIGVLLSNYYNHGEGISNSLMEFMALGRPVIASDNGGNNELISHDCNGYIVDKFNNIILIEKYIQRLLDNSELRNELGLNAKQSIKTRFCLEKMVNSFHQKYTEIIDSQ